MLRMSRGMFFQEKSACGKHVDHRKVEAERRVGGAGGSGHMGPYGSISVHMGPYGSYGPIWVNMVHMGSCGSI